MLEHKLYLILPASHVGFFFYAHFLLLLRLLYFCQADRFFVVKFIIISNLPSNNGNASNVENKIYK